MTNKLIEASMTVLHKMQLGESESVPLGVFHSMLSREKIVYPHLRREALRYLESIGEIRVDLAHERVVVLHMKPEYSESTEADDDA